MIELWTAVSPEHARARTPEETDWSRIAALYDTLAQLAPSPVIELNRAVALAMALAPMGLVQRLHLPQPEAGDQPRGLDEGPVDDAPLLAREPNPGLLLDDVLTQPSASGPASNRW